MKLDEIKLRHRWDKPVLIASVLLNICILIAAIWLARNGADWLESHPWIGRHVGSLRSVSTAAVLAIPALVFTRNGRRALVRANSVLLSPRQVPAIYEVFQQHCETLGLDPPPELYFSESAISETCTGYSSFRKDYVVLATDFLQSDLFHMRVVFSFELARELSRIYLGHTTWLNDLFLSYVLVTPFVRNPLNHVRTYTHDRYGAAMSPNAGLALMAHASGRRMFTSVDFDEYLRTTTSYGGFWARLASLTKSRPPLAYRIQALQDAGLLSPNADLNRQVCQTGGRDGTC